jgi:hypothetical protein
LLNVYRKNAPLASWPESKVVPSSEVAVWAKAPLFVQQTVSPWLIVGLDGVNEYSAIVITVSPEVQLPAGRACPEEASPVPGRTTRSANSASENPLPIPIAAKILLSDGNSRRPGRNVRSGP